MIKNKFNYMLVLLAVGLFSNVLTSCDDHGHDDDHKHDEGETINSVTLEFYKPNDSLAIFTTTWSDEDGVGGNHPILPDTIKLQKDSVYKVKAIFSHVSGTSKHDITAEIKNEGYEHLICYTPKTIIQAIVIEINRTDRDTKNFEIGLESEWKGVINEKGSIQLSLKHQPNIKNGTCGIGETDIEVDFPFVIK